MFVRSLLAGAAVAAAFAIAAPAQAQLGGLTRTQCFVAAPYDRSENVRLSPNGEIVNRLRNGRRVVVSHIDYDAQGRPWAYVEGEYNGQWRRWGFIFTESLAC